VTPEHTLSSCLNKTVLCPPVLSVNRGLSLPLAIFSQEIIHVVTNTITEVVADVTHGIEAVQHDVTLPIGFCQSSRQRTWATPSTLGIGPSLTHGPAGSAAQWGFCGPHMQEQEDKLLQRGVPLCPCATLREGLSKGIRVAVSRTRGRGYKMNPPAMPAIATPRNVSGMVSIITPTYNRSKFLKSTLKYFLHQNYNDIEWLILDDGLQETTAFGDLAGRNIFYERIGGKLSIGEKRNLLIERSRGEIIVQFDDDDYYSPDYVRIMVSNLANLGADLLNLRGWFLYDCRSHFFGYWNLMQKKGLHYRCDQKGVVLGMVNSQNNRDLENSHLGYGFSYVFKKEVWNAVKFPEIDWNEDTEFSLKASSKFKVDGIQDTRGICLHLLHLASTSHCFPQYHLPSFLLQKLFPAVDYPVVVPEFLDRVRLSGLHE
jgi:Glycosyl transferase family 2